jgi:hypothetical protein
MGVVEVQPAPTAAPPAPAGPVDDDEERAQNLITRAIAAYEELEFGPENAQKWVAVENIDDQSCGPCKAVNGKTYRNRADAYADYPGGTGYVNCEGRDNCRGHVVKRGRKGSS